MQPDGDAALLNYHIVGVTRDGIPEPWHLDWHIGLMSIVVGDKQRFLPQGDYHYQIHYQVKNAFLREGDSDLLIWNVTGNHWPFEIYKTRFSLKFPDIAGNPFSEIDLFTGEEGDTYRGFAPIFPDTCYHLTHYWPAAADIPVASDNPVHYADAIRYNARTPLQGSLLPLTRLV